MFYYSVSLLVCISLIAGENNITSSQCTTPNDEEGVCVSIFSCPQMLKMISSLQQTQIEFVQKSVCGESLKNVLVCCRIQDLQLINQVSPGNNSKYAEVNVKLRDSNVVIAVGHSENEQNLILTFKKDYRGSDYFNLRIKSRTNHSLATNNETLEQFPLIMKDKSSQRVSDESSPNEAASVSAEDINKLISSVFGSNPNFDSNTSEENLQGIVESSDNTVLSTRDECGNLLPEIQNIEDYPWMVYLLNDTVDSTSGDLPVKCTGVLINQRYVLSIDPCVKGITEVYVGVFNKNRSFCQDLEREEIISPIKIEDIIYEAYDEFGSYRVALIRLAENVVFSDCRQPICLPLDQNVIQSPEDLVVSSWETKPGGNKKSLPQVAVRNTDCIEYTGSEDVCTRNGSVIFISRRDKGQQFIEQIEQGGPVMYKYRNKWFLHAILSLVFYPVNSERLDRIDANCEKITLNTINWIYSSIKP